MISIGTVFLGMFGGFYSTFCPAWNPQLTDRVLFHECHGLLVRTPLLSINGVKGENVKVPVRGSEATLDGWFYKAPGAKKVFLFSHGNAGTCSDRCQKIGWMLSLGQSVFIYDYEGYGMSTGHSSPKTVVDDVCAAFDYLTEQQHYQPNQIIAYGESIGTGVCAELMSSRYPGAVVLESGFASVEALGKAFYPPLRVFPHCLWFTPALSPIDMVRKCHVPVLIIHGRHDTIIPYDQAQDVYAAAHEPKRLVILDHSQHNDCSPDLPLYLDGLRKLIDTDLDGKKINAMR
jgi:fermentation-respiration switch protein FrsA (DUF1100 family)